MAYNRYRAREKFRRVYTFTRTKALIAFVLSTIFSIFLSSYFDRYGRLIFKKTSKGVGELIETKVSIPTPSAKLEAAREVEPRPRAKAPAKKPKPKVESLVEFE